MPTTITPAAADPSGETYTTPADGDAINAASVNGAFQKLANFIAWLRANPVTRPSLPVVGQQISDSSGAFSDGTGAWVPVTNLTVALETTGRPVVVALQNDGVAGHDASFIKAESPVAPATAYLRIKRDGTVIAATVILAASTSLMLPPSSFSVLDVPGAGAHTYTVEAESIGVGGTVGVQYAVLVAYEL